MALGLDTLATFICYWVIIESWEEYVIFETLFIPHKHINQAKFPYKDTSKAIEIASCYKLNVPSKPQYLLHSIYPSVCPHRGSNNVKFSRQSTLRLPSPSSKHAV